MSAIDEFRRLLDERGVKWRESVNVSNCVFTVYESPIFGDVAAMDNDGTLYYHELNGIDVEPEQAILVTLGGGECVFEINTDATAIKCSSCGYSLPKGTDLGDTRFCGGCGKAVKR